MPKIQLKRGFSHIDRARAIQATLGTFTAARYLAKREWSIDAALHILLRK